jgi:hypothetical protein
MKRKTFHSLVTAICILALTACSPTARTATTAGNNIFGATATLACSGGATSATLTPTVRPSLRQKFNFDLLVLLENCKCQI